MQYHYNDRVPMPVSQKGMQTLGSPESRPCRCPFRVLFMSVPRTSFIQRSSPSCTMGIASNTYGTSYDRVSPPPVTLWLGKGSTRTQTQDLTNLLHMPQTSFLLWSSSKVPLNKTRPHRCPWMIGPRGVFISHTTSHFAGVGDTSSCASHDSRNTKGSIHI